MAKCIVLQTSGPYLEEHAAFLRSLLDQGPELFAVVGPGCLSWEDAMDWLCIDLKATGEIPECFCSTTSHPDEKLHEVIAFAKQWCGGSDVDVVRI